MLKFLKTFRVFLVHLFVWETKYSEQNMQQPTWGEMMRKNIFLCTVIVVLFADANLNFM